MQMETLQHQIKIKAPIEKVWNTLVNLENVDKYNFHIKTVKCLSDKKGVGASRKCEFKSKGFAKERIVALTKFKSISMEMYESDFPINHMEWTYFLSFDNGITTLKTITEYRVKYGVLGVLLNFLIIKSKFNKTMNEVFESLKIYVESI